MKLSSAGKTFVTAAGFLGAVALVTLNTSLLLALTPVFIVLFICTIYQPPMIHSIYFSEKPLHLQRGETAELNLKLKYGNGPGFFGIDIIWPEQLSKPEDVKNIIWFPEFGGNSSLNQKIYAEYTGVVKEVLVRSQSYSLFPLFQFENQKNYTLPEIKVHPDRRVIDRVGETTSRSNVPMPALARAEMGLRSSEFKELREYQAGDPYRFINWKATARNITPTGKVPVVNEYEREGRQLVWIYLNAAEGMWQKYAGARRIDYAVEVVIALAKLYLENSCRIGYSTFNSNAEHLLPPESGNKQLHRLTEQLLQLSPAETDNSDHKLSEIVYRTRPYYHGSWPLSFVITYFEDDTDFDELKIGLRKLVAVSGKPRVADGVVQVSLLPTAVGLQEEIKSLARRFEKIELVAKLSDFVPGVRRLGWDPGESTVSKLLAELARC